MNINCHRILFVFSLVLASCTPPLPPAPTSAPTQNSPKLGPLVPTGEQEVIELGTTVEEVWNCGDGGGTIVKHPSRSISTNYSVEWEVGGSIGVGVIIGEGVIPAGVNLSGALEGHYQSGFGSGYQQTTSWDLPAEPNTIVNYTLVWREIWEKGYIDLLMPDNTNLRVNVRYRTHIGSDNVGKQVISCDDLNTVSSQSATVAPVQPTQVNQSVNVQAYSSFTQDDINRLLGDRNWHCIDGFANSISIDNLPPGFLVQFPFIRIDKQDKFYYQGDIVIGGGYATGWLENNLPGSNCSLDQPELTKSSIDGLIGAGNWYCLDNYPTGVKVINVLLAFIVETPAVMVDKYDIRYYKLQTVPSGGPATVWFANEISRSECR